MAVLVSTKGKWYAGAETRVHVRLESPTEIAVDIFEKGKDGEHMTSDAYPATAAGVREVNEVLRGEGVKSTVVLPKGAGETFKCKCGKATYRTGTGRSGQYRCIGCLYVTDKCRCKKVAAEISDIETFISGPHRFAGLGDICTRCGRKQESWAHSDKVKAGERSARVILRVRL